MKKIWLILALNMMVFISHAIASYPERMIEVIVPFGEGSESDIFARKFAALLSEKLGITVQPINKKGGSGLIGMVFAAQQQNNGYTILEITPSHVISDLVETAPFKLMRDFEPLARIQSDMYILGVQKNSKFQNFKDMVVYGRDHEIIFAGVSSSALDNMTLAALSEATNMKLKYVPYKSGAEVRAALVSGEVDVYFDKIISAVKYIKDGSVRPMVVLGDERIRSLEVLNDVPCTVELGYNITISSWRGFVVKKETPQEIKDLLIAKMKEVSDSPEYKLFAEQTLTNLSSGYLDADGFAKQWAKEYKILDPIAKKIGLKK
jgi:tripartite-type tricarboxylate transporter receptor subunit TctC